MYCSHGKPHWSVGTAGTGGTEGTAGTGGTDGMGGTGGTCGTGRTGPPMATPDKSNNTTAVVAI